MYGSTLSAVLVRWICIKSGKQEKFARLNAGLKERSLYRRSLYRDSSVIERERNN